jgi:hypothetical protein
MASPNPNQLLRAIQDLYLLLEGNISDILAKCTSEAQRKHAIAQYSSARDAFWKAHASVLEDNNDTVKGIYADLRATTARIKDSLESLQNIARFLRLVTEGVRLAGALAALAAVA